MLDTIPIIEKIIQHENAFICTDAKNDVICICQDQEIANLYYIMPEIIKRYIDIISAYEVELNKANSNIEDLNKAYTELSTAYNKLAMVITSNGSNLIH
jgi:hypothetical protein